MPYWRAFTEILFLYNYFIIYLQELTFLVDQKVNESCPKIRTHFVFWTIMLKGFDPL